MNLGLLGAASVASRSVIAPARRLADVQVLAVAASAADRAASFAQKHAIPRVFPDYAALLACEEVDAVYIALPNDLHEPWAIATARAKKHVLVEKPLCLDRDGAARIREAARENGVHVLEGVMTQHHPWESALADLVREQRLGRLLHLRTEQTFRLAPGSNYRFCRKHGGGVFLDESCYWLRLLQALHLLPLREADTQVVLVEGGEVDSTCRVRARAGESVEVEALFSYDGPYEATHYLTFSEGRIRIRNFLAPSLGDFRIRIDVQDQADKAVQGVVFAPDNYFLRQMDFFARVIRGQHENIPLEQSIERIAAMEELYCKSRVLS